VLRRLARGVILNEPLGDLSTLENPGALEALRVIVAGGSYADAVAALVPSNPSSKG